MPGMSGLQATGAIRALPGGAKVPILALTAQAMSGDRERILGAGCDDYLAKPVPPKELRAIVTRLIAVDARPTTRRCRRHRTGNAKGDAMARILLVDNDDRRSPRGRARSRRSASRSSNRSSRSRRRWSAPPRPVIRSCCCRPPASRRRSRRARRRAADVLRETFDVFEDGVCLLARDGSLKVANAIGERLFRSVLKAELQSVASEATQRRRDRGSQPVAGRAGLRGARLSAVGAGRRPLRPRRDRRARARRSAACSPRSSRRSGCSPPVSRTRSTTRRRSCWRTSKR